jgi:hypothetical protein
MLSPSSPWRWRQHGPPKHCYPTTGLHGVTTQKTLTWIFNAMKTSNLVRHWSVVFHYFSHSFNSCGCQDSTNILFSHLFSSSSTVISHRVSCLMTKPCTFSLSCHMWSSYMCVQSFPTFFCTFSFTLSSHWLILQCPHHWCSQRNLLLSIFNKCPSHSLFNVANFSCHACASRSCLMFWVWILSVPRYFVLKFS